MRHFSYSKFWLIMLANNVKKILVLKLIPEMSSQNVYFVALKYLTNYNQKTFILLRIEFAKHATGITLRTMS
jgi:hypothetical protein